MLTPWEVDGRGDLIPATRHYLFFLSKHGSPKKQVGRQPSRTKAGMWDNLRFKDPPLEVPSFLSPFRSQIIGHDREDRMGRSTLSPWLPPWCEQGSVLESPKSTSQLAWMGQEGGKGGAGLPAGFRMWARGMDTNQH